jgi:hypothetical protein
MKFIVDNTIHEYNTVMEDYTKNTGGGDSDETSHIVWQEHKDAAAIVHYDRKVKGADHCARMWSKIYFPLVTTKDPIPDSCNLVDVDDDDDDDDGN